MANLKQNWINSDERSVIALEHTRTMYAKYPEEIKEAIECTRIYDVDWVLEDESVIHDNTNIIVDDIDTVSGARKYLDGRTAVLNFASYKHPGGAFLLGSIAQEEALCHESFLFNVLHAFKDSYYEWNNKNKNKALYLNRALYSPDIIFEGNDFSFKCDVITCAAPNKSTAHRFQHVSNEENAQVISERIKFVLDIARDNQIDTLILGAFGCGVFGQNPREVANLFKYHLENNCKGYFKTVVFAIPNRGNSNFDVFKSVFNNVF